MTARRGTPQETGKDRQCKKERKMDTPLNERAAGVAAGGPKSDGAFLGRNADKNSANNASCQKKTATADSLDPGVLLVLRTLTSPFKDDGENGPTTFRRRRLAKLVKRDGEVVPYEGARHHQADGLDVSDFGKLFDGLTWLSGEWAIAVVQGGKRDSASTRRMRRIIYDTPDEDDPKIIHPWTITDKPSIILPIDIDDLVPSADVLGLRAIASWVIKQLPPEFHGVRCIAVATGSYGFKRGAHIRLWFMLDRALTCAEKRRWLKPLAKIGLAGVGFVKFVDIGLYTPNQLVYTATPLFEDPNDDPLCDAPRLIVIDGEEEFVRTPHAERLKPTAHDYHAHQHAYHAPISRVAGKCGGGDDNGLILSAMVAIDAATPGERHTKIMREAFFLAGFAVGGGVIADMALRGLIRAGTKIIPGARVIKPDEIIREWNHALAVKHAEWQLEQAHDSASDDGEDL
jgi:hypothetical protein